MKRTDWMYRFWVKAAAFLLAAALAPTLLVCAVSLLCAYQENWWASDAYDVYETDFVRGAVYEQMAHTRDYYEHFGAEIADEPHFADARHTNYRFALYDADGGLVFDNLSTDGVALKLSNPLTDGGRIESGVARELTAQDGIFWTARATDALHAIFHSAVPLSVGAALALLILVIFLARAAGRQPGVEGAVPGWQEKIPFDLYLAAAGLGGFALAALLVELIESGSVSDLPLLAAGCLACVTALGVLALAAWMTLCARVKLGRWWRSTVTWRALCLARRVLRWCARLLRAFGRAARDAVRAVPLVWRTVLLLLGVSFAEFCAIVTARYDVENLLVLWLFERLLLFPAVFYFAWELRKLQAVGAALAAGNLDARVDTKHMYWDLRGHGENLNDISRGMQRAVEKQLRSERLKTELIANVSHDIKTPLTSIVNYVELLRRDGAGEHAAEYLEVLERQSRRLKKLTEDLVEVSKAATGNLAVNASRRSVNELLTQALGEYSERLEKAGLTPVLTLPEREIFVRADGALLWRVLDNLFSNACKYALPGTRFYIAADAEEERVRMSFKNISRDELNVSADELLERFVRGDAARSGEGSGLGLDIARSLTEAQGGTFRLGVDGDLFRADVELPVYE